MAGLTQHWAFVSPAHLHEGPSLLTDRRLFSGCRREPFYYAPPSTASHFVSTGFSRRPTPVPYHEHQQRDTEDKLVAKHQFCGSHVSYALTECSIVSVKGVVNLTGGPGLDTIPYYTFDAKHTAAAVIRRV